MIHNILVAIITGVSNPVEDFVVVIIKEENAVMDLVVVIIKGDNPVMVFEVIIEMDIQPGAGAGAGADVVVNLVVVITPVGGMISKIHMDMVKDKVVVHTNMRKIPIIMYHITNQQFVIVVKFGAMLQHNANGFMSIFQVWLKNFAKCDFMIV